MVGRLVKGLMLIMKAGRGLMFNRDSRVVKNKFRALGQALTRSVKKAIFALCRIEMGKNNVCSIDIGIRFG